MRNAFAVTTKWLALGSIAGVLAGLASALFLFTLDLVTGVRLAYPMLIWGLPLAGLVSVAVYGRFGGAAKAGIPLIFAAVHRPATAVPVRMAPFVLLGTLVTHLFGGSAGREGTAIQMAGGLTAGVNRLFRLPEADRSVVLQAGIAAGFASVFGTPFAGTVFALEVLTGGRLFGNGRWRMLVPATVAAAFVGDMVTRMFVGHTQYVRPPIPAFSVHVALKLVVAAIAFGLAAFVFVCLVNQVKKAAARFHRYPPLAGLVGGGFVVALTMLMGTHMFNGLGVPTIEAAVRGEALPPLAFLAKTIMTAVTVGSGFQGGEVTPLFFIGATLGNALGFLINMAPAFLAAVGFVAVFAGATKTPWACAVMALELFGVAIWPYVLVACLISAAVSGRRTIYSGGV